MKDNVLRKGLVYAIVVLFVGAGVVPSISGDIETDRKETNGEKGTAVIENSVSMDSIIGIEENVPSFDGGMTIVSIQPPAQCVEKGERFDVGIYVEPSELIRGVGVDIYYDPTLIQANWVFDGDLFGIIPTLFDPGTIDNINGKITGIVDVTLYGDGDSDPGYLCNITFIAQQELGISPLDLQNVDITDIHMQPLPSTVIDGEVTVADYFTLTILYDGDGSGDVTKSPDQSSYPSGDNVKLTAIPDDGWKFDGWSGDIIGSDNPIILVVQSDMTEGVIATFPETGILYVGGSGPGNYSKIQDAIDNASDGGTVFVFDDSSPYYENIIINKNAINLIGENKDTTIIDANGIGNVVTISAHEISVTGFTIRNSREFGDLWDGCGIYIFSLSTDYHHTTIIGNNILDNGVGVLIGCRCEYTYVGENSIINNQQWGIGCLQLSSHSTISKNVIANTNGGYPSIRAGISLGVSDFNIIEGNIIHDNEGDGIEVESSSDNEIYNNKISNNLGAGIDVEYASPDNFFHHNIFINNNPNADGCTYVNIWDNDYPSGGNFWDDYSGVDYFSGPNQDIPGSDGIGDTYYDIPGCNDEDRYPLMNLSPVFITDVAILTSEPLDTDPGFGWENMSCTVTSIIGVDEVKLIVTNPIDAVVEYPMQKLFGTDNYYFNITLTDVGEYEYCIWATDIHNNLVTSASMEFYLPHNADIDMDGECYFYDLGAVVALYGTTGPYDGWIREDVDNDGEVYFYDLGAIVSMYGETWS